METYPNPESVEPKGMPDAHAIPLPEAALTAAKQVADGGTKVPVLVAEEDRGGISSVNIYHAIDRFAESGNPRFTFKELMGVLSIWTRERDQHAQTVTELKVQVAKLQVQGNLADKLSPMSGGLIAVGGIAATTGISGLFGIPVGQAMAWLIVGMFVMAVGFYIQYSVRK